MSLCWTGEVTLAPFTRGFLRLAKPSAQLFCDYAHESHFILTWCQRFGVVSFSFHRLVCLIDVPLIVAFVLYFDGLNLLLRHHSSVDDTIRLDPIM